MRDRLCCARGRRLCVHTPPWCGVLPHGYARSVSWSSPLFRKRLRPLHLESPTRQLPTLSNRIHKKCPGTLGLAFKTRKTTSLNRAARCLQQIRGNCSPICVGITRFRSEERRVGEER